MCSNGIHAGRISHEDDSVGQLFGLQMQVEAGAVGVDNKFGFREMSFAHEFSVIFD
jgi:hypothetical protein